MTSRDDDGRVARALEQLRRADEASAPSFRSTLTSARAGRASRRPALGPVLAAAALLVFIAGLLIVVSRNPPASRRPASATPSAKASLESWESPTDFLLDTPGSEIWRGLPSLPEPLPSNPPISPSSPKKGVPS